VSVDADEFGSSIPAFSDLAQSDHPDDDLKHLSGVRKRELQTLLMSFSDIFSEIPGKTSLSCHHIELAPGSKPVASAPYRLNPEKMEVVNKEIKELLR
jgi:hypothetical protein